MVNVKVNGKPVEVREGANIITAAKKAGCNIPTLCEFKNLNEIGACRICLVEVEGQERLVAACNTVVEEGKNYLTSTPKVMEARKTNLKLILSQHKTECTTCVRSGNCSLQSLAQDMNVLDVPYEVTYKEVPWNKNFPLIRDASKCIKCWRCVQVCDNVQAMHVWDIKNHGTRTGVGVTGDLAIEETKCILCGQCITHCPVGA